jgi:methionyl aminopeptidase
MITIKTPEEIQIMRQAGRILAQVMKEVVEMAKPGIKTKDLDKAAEGLILKYGAKPSFKGYQGFPAAFCISVNEEIVHCLPSERKLQEGDIVSLDGGLVLNGFQSDMAVTVPVGKVSPEAQRLIRVARESLKKGIKKIKPGRTVGDIGNAVQRYAESQGYNVVRELCGHGIGRQLHEDPQIPNYGKKGGGEKIKEGMVFCLEPMITAGDWKIKRAKDGYGCQTKDGSLSAHFEQTIAVRKDGCEVLTKC